MKKTTRVTAGGVVISLGALVAATPRFLFPVCEYYGHFMKLPNGKTGHMPCFYTASASYLIGMLVCFIGVTLLLAKDRNTIRLLAVVLAGVAIGVILLPVIFPICQNPDDPCNHGAKPMIIVLGIMTMMMAGWLGFSSRRSTVNYSLPRPAQPEQ